MKPKNIIQVSMILIVTSLIACNKKYDEYIVNPNRAERVPPFTCVYRGS